MSIDGQIARIKWQAWRENKPRDAARFFQAAGQLVINKLPGAACVKLAAPRTLAEQIGLKRI